MIFKLRSGLNVGAVFTAVAILSACSSNDEQNDTIAEPAPIQRTCEIGKPTSGRVFVKSDNTRFYMTPDKNGDRIINARATEILGETHYRDLDPVYVLEALCENDKWLQAEIVEVEGSPQNWETGWVEKSKVTREQSSDQKAGLFWDIDREVNFSPTEKALLREGAMKVLKEEPNCESIMTGDKSGSRKGQYYVSCNARNGAEPFNIWFSLEDVKSGKSLAAPQPVNETAARKMCVEAIKNSVTHPSTLDIHAITGYATRVTNGGHRDITQTFTAKNSLGLDLEYSARCVIMPDGKLELAINEKS